MQSGIDCGETCSVTYTEGTKIVLNAVAADGSEFVEWRVNGETVSGPVEVTQDTTVLAVFDEVTPPEDAPVDSTETPQP